MAVRFTALKSSRTLYNELKYLYKRNHLRTDFDMQTLKQSGRCAVKTCSIIGLRYFHRHEKKVRIAWMHDILNI